MHISKISTKQTIKKKKGHYSLAQLAIRSHILPMRQEEAQRYISKISNKANYQAKALNCDEKKKKARYSFVP